MGQEQNKYHVSSDGKVFRVNEDGSFTEIGNVESLMNSNNDIGQTNRKNPKKLNWVLIILMILGPILIIVGIVLISLFSMKYSGSTDRMYYGDDDSLFDFVPGNIIVEDSVAFRSYFNENQYCNGIYEPESSRKWFHVNLDSEFQFNRYHFAINCNYKPIDSGTILVLSDGWRILKFYITQEWRLGVSTNNGDYLYSTDISVLKNDWNSIEAEYYDGELSLNGLICKDVIIDMENGDDFLSSVDFSCGDCFKGWLANIEVISFCSR